LSKSTRWNVYIAPIILLIKTVILNLNKNIFMNRLENKVAVGYGNGAIGAAVAKAFAREGAMVFLTGRTVPE
jgi:short-subunit dehydrogenase